MSPFWYGVFCGLLGAYLLGAAGIVAVFWACGWRPQWMLRRKMKRV